MMAAFKAKGCKHGDQGEREQQRTGEREDDGECDRREQLAFETLESEQRQEDECDDDDASRDRHDDLA